MSVVIDSRVRSALDSTRAALQRLADDHLPPDLDRRMLDLGERKEFLTDDEHRELLAWVDFTQRRSMEKAEAIRALHRIRAAEDLSIVNP